MLERDVLGTAIGATTAGEDLVERHFYGAYAQVYTREARFEGAEWTALETGAPVLVGALAAFDCRVTDTKAFGSHTLFFGEVVAMASGESMERAALVYFNRGYASLNTRPPAA